NKGRVPAFPRRSLEFADLRTRFLGLPPSSDRISRLPCRPQERLAKRSFDLARPTEFNRTARRDQGENREPGKTSKPTLYRSGSVIRAERIAVLSWTSLLDAGGHIQRVKNLDLRT